MKIFKLMAVALVAMFGFVACNNDCDHEFIEYDYNEALVGTWTCLEAEQAEAMVINPDGSFTTTGVMKGGSLYEENGTIKVVNNKVSLVFDGDKEAIEGRLELVSGKSMSIVFNDEYDIRLTYDYCKEDLSDEIIGMWVCTDAPTETGEATIVHTFMENGKAIYTGYGTRVDEYLVNEETTYDVVGDLLFYALPKDKITEGEDSYITKKLTYKPSGLAYGDIMEEKTMKSTSTMLRIKQQLELANKSYNYSANYITNAKGSDFTILDYTFEASNVDGSRLDQMLKGLLFSVEFPDANTIKYKYRYNNEEVPFEAPIEVEGNKVTIKMSAKESAYRDIEVYMFQDQDNTQLHMYMHTKSFINLFGNLQLNALKSESKIDLTDAAAVEKVFADLSECIESINFTLVFKTR